MRENHVTDECAQLNALSKLNDWDTGYRQVGAGKFSTSFNLYFSTGIRFTDQYYNREMMVYAAPPPGHAALFFVTDFWD